MDYNKLLEIRRKILEAEKKNYVEGDGLPPIRLEEKLGRIKAVDEDIKNKYIPIFNTQNWMITENHFLARNCRSKYMPKIPSTNQFFMDDESFKFRYCPLINGVVKLRIDFTEEHSFNKELEKLKEIFKEWSFCKLSDATWNYINSEEYWIERDKMMNKGYSISTVDILAECNERNLNFDLLVEYLIMIGTLPVIKWIEISFVKYGNFWISAVDEFGNYHNICFQISYKESRVMNALRSEAEVLFNDKLRKNVSRDLKIVYYMRYLFTFYSDLESRIYFPNMKGYDKVDMGVIKTYHMTILFMVAINIIMERSEK